MPKISFSKKDLENVMGFEIDDGQLESYFFPAKGELDSLVDGNITSEITDSNRPDLWSVEGIAREIKGHLGLMKGVPKYDIGRSDYVVNVSGKNSFNPYAGAAIIRDIEITEDLLISMINLQEKVCNTYGRKRSEFAMGIYSLDKISGKNIYYTVVDKKTKFAPLGHDNEMTLEEVLEKHKTGIEYGHLIKDLDKYPVWLDEKKQVMSLPPVINSNHSGRVELGKQDLFLEVTGNNQEKVDVALLIAALAFADRGAKIECVKINYLDANKSFYTLDQTPIKLDFDKQKIFDYLGEELDDSTIIEYLERKHYNAKIEDDKVFVEYPKYRQDILHPVDVIEDIIIECNYNLIKPKKIEFYTTGGLLKTTEWNNLIREASLGLGLQELLNFTLTSTKKQYDNLFISEENRNAVEIANPMSESIAIFRERVLPEILEVLSKNQHISYPQNVFELGKVAFVEKENGKEKVKEENHLCVALCYNEVSYTNIKQRLDALLNAIDAKDVAYEPFDLSYAINKRSAKVTFKLDNKTLIGTIGELSPETLLAFGLNMPVVYFEINVDKY